MPKLTLRGGVESFSRDDSTYTVSVTQWDPIFEDDSTLRVSVMVPDAPLRLRRAPIPAGYQVHCSGLILGVLNLGDATDMLSIVIEDIMVFRLTKLPRSINLWRQGTSFFMYFYFVQLQLISPLQDLKLLKPTRMKVTTEICTLLNYH